MKKGYLELQESFIDGETDLFIDLPEQLMMDLDWYPGDELIFEVEGDSIKVYKRG